MYDSTNRMLGFSSASVFCGTVSMPGSTRSCEIAASGTYIGLGNSGAAMIGAR
jgi:hypothetical protein